MTFKDAARHTAQIAYDIDEELSIVPTFYSWPSRGRYLAYRADLANAEFSKPRLKEFLKLIAEESGAGAVHVIAHSMGSEALRYALENLGSSVKEPLFRHIILAAPDIDAHIFSEQILPWLKKMAEKTTVYCSRTDKALWASKLFRGIKAAGYDPIVSAGVDTIDVTGVDATLVKHSYFRESTALLYDLYYLLLRELGPDQRKGPRRRAGPEGPYWVLAPW